ncbi:site-specific tyrosine recombinase XerD [Candidatus Termititenax persephonae]|uniref:Site-specific tyrosine recombinase XerD n=1 Tax=Candidatus Termititenax persephonae TaxID=2218525 RepID=A0A388THK7_9BACT|nr:site-specific tyrosine recombinase XerD [Candidatus Termititenax persephonae]
MNELELFAAYMSGKGWKEITKYTYKIIIKNFISNNPDYRYFDSTKARNLVNAIRQTKTRKTTRQMVIVFKYFYHCLGLDPQIWNIRIVPERKIPKHLSQEKINCILDNIQGEDIYTIRDKAIYELIYAAGLRTSEVRDVTISDINSKEMYIKIGKKRAYFGNRAKEAIIKYLNIREQFNPVSEQLFLNVHGKPISRQKILSRLKKYSGSSPLELRNSLAVHLFDNGADAKSVQKIMRYRRTNHINRYVELSKPFKDKMLGYASL